MQTNGRKKHLAFGGFNTVRYAVQRVWHEIGFLVRIAVKWRAAMASRVPVGYEDATGFHYGGGAGDGLFLTFDSGGRSLFSAGSFTPTSLATVARIGFRA